MTSLIQNFEADFLWKVSLKILNSGIILKTFTHVYNPLTYGVMILFDCASIRRKKFNLSLFVENSVDPNQLDSSEAN